MECFMKQKILLSLAVFFGVLTFILVNNFLREKEQNFKAMAKEVYLTRASQTIGAGEIITSDHLEVAKVLRQRSYQYGDDIPWKKSKLIVGYKAARSDCAW